VPTKNEIEEMNKIVQEFPFTKANILALRTPKPVTALTVLKAGKNLTSEIFFLKKILL
jgi:hypothetical protein